MIRNDVVNIKKYVPEYLVKDKVISTNFDSQSKEHEKLRLLILEVLAQFFVKTATWGLAIWEETVGLPNGTGMDLEIRRRNIIAKLLGTATTTKQLIKKIAEALVKCESVEVIEQFDNYFFKLIFNNVDNGMTIHEELIRRIEDIKPAHLGFGLTVQREKLLAFVVGGARQIGTHLTIKPASLFLPKIQTNVSIGVAYHDTRYITIKPEVV